MAFGNAGHRRNRIRAKFFERFVIESFPENLSEVEQELAHTIVGFLHHFGEESALAILCRAEDGGAGPAIGICVRRDGS